MKKIGVIILLFCYLMPAIGLSVTQHYCGGKLVSVSVFSASSPKCSCGKKLMKKDCCEDKIIVLKLKDTQNFAKKVVGNFSQTFKLITQCFPIYNGPAVTLSFEKHLPFSHPPLQKSESLYLLNQVFLI